MESLPPSLIAQIKRVELRSKRLVDQSLSGNYRSAFRGSGMEFEEVRDYVPGDDIRRIDWNVTARMRAPFIKIHREERELSMMLAVDVSASFRFGSVRRSKGEVAAEVAAIFAYLAIRNQDRVGLMLFSDDIEHYIPPKKGRGHVFRIIREVLTHQPHNSRGTDIEAAALHLGRVYRQRGMVFLLSDFLGPHIPENAIRTLSARHELTAVRISDPREKELPAAGLFSTYDLESGKRRVLDCGDRRTRELFIKSAIEREHKQSEILRRSGAGIIDISCLENTADPIVRHFRGASRGR